MYLHYVALLLLSCICLCSANHGLIVSYDLASTGVDCGQNCPPTPQVNVLETGASVTATNIVSTAGLQSWIFDEPGFFGALGWNLNLKNDRFEYLEWTVTPGASCVINYTEITYSVGSMDTFSTFLAGQSNLVFEMQLWYSVDSFATETLLLVREGLPGNGLWLKYTDDISKIGAQSAPVTFRMYFGYEWRPDKAGYVGLGVSTKLGPHGSNLTITGTTCSTQAPTVMQGAPSKAPTPTPTAAPTGTAATWPPSTPVEYTETARLSFACDSVDQLAARCSPGVAGMGGGTITLICDNTCRSYTDLCAPSIARGYTCNGNVNNTTPQGNPPRRDYFLVVREFTSTTCAPATRVRDTAVPVIPNNEYSGACVHTGTSRVSLSSWPNLPASGTSWSSALLPSSFVLVALSLLVFLIH